MNITTLKYPDGEFTQAELAEFNGMEKLAVYLPLKEAEAKGILVKTGIARLVRDLPISTDCQ